MTAKNNNAELTQARCNWVKVPELAARTGLSKTKIRSLIEEGVIAADRQGSGYYRIPREEMERFISEGFRYAPART